MHWERLLDEARSDDLARARARERSLRRQATEAATLLGSLLDLAESGTTLSITVLGGRRHDGTLVGVGHDVVVLVEREQHVAIRVDAITVARPAPGSRAVAAAGDRSASLDLGFVELVARVVDEQPDVAAALVTGETLAGSLVAVGADVFTLRVAAGADGLAYCPSVAVSSMRFRSG